MSDPKPKAKSSKLGKEFYLLEFFTFITQLLVFLLVSYLASDMYSNEKSLTTFVTEKVNSGVLKELGLTFIAITFVMGLLTLIKTIASHPLIEKVATEVLYELPRTIYLFGSNVSAAILTAGIYLLNHPEPTKMSPTQLILASLWIAAAFFLYGLAIKGALTKRRARKALELT